ncbi:hypothetical protein B0T24DRAFT_613931 [Lasiosphaeria ovina]|uniref:BHLH domain-containing protein n=1 Tax=Lasiosphaeria ovina TaxID=92902 RepID=A0AAE0NEI7_9PEZI|nr:hypothetical protein B0T24DRAFT_613931 [Lasiosphaeria ovina]
MGSPSSLSPMTGQYEFTALGDPYSAPGPANLGSHVSPASLQHQHQPALEFVSYADAGPSKPAIGTGSGSGSGSGSGPRAKAKLRRASSSSKNVQTRDAEPSNEQKTRKSHNFVEKQYRNRLNAQFEALLDALPDTVKSSQISPAAASGGDSDLDLGERRLSKGEVLDLSRRYIGTLERERDALDRERHDLAANMDRLRAAYMRMQGESSEAKPE